jgi:hypothetical protein
MCRSVESLVSAVTNSKRSHALEGLRTEHSHGLRLCDTRQNPLAEIPTMTNAFMHPERALAVSTQQSSDTTVPTESPVSAELLSPGAEAARKECINEQMVGLLNKTILDRSYPVNTKNSIQGMGLYTHASVPGSSDRTTAQKLSSPEFLPLGGPRNVLTYDGLFQEPLREEMQQIWEHAEAMINEEERLIKEASLSEEQLRERYDALKVPDSNETAIALSHKQPQIQQFLEALRKLQAQKPSRNDVLGGTDDEGDVGASSGAHPAPRANMYHESRDPRRRG